MNKKLKRAKGGLAFVQKNFDALMLGGVPKISDNLTAAEYKVFRQGLGVWWWTFNEKDGEENE